MNRKLLFPIVIGLLTSFIVNGQAPVPSFTTSVTSGCGPLVVNFNGSTTNGPVTWSWNFGGTSPAVIPGVSALQNPVVVFNTAGTYSVTLTVTNGSGSNTTAPVIITVYPSPIANFKASDTVACSPHNIQFTDLSIPGPGATITSWLWDYGDGHIDTAIQNPTHRYTLQGNFPVALYIKNSYGCTGSAAIKTISGYISITSGVNPSFSDSLSSSCKPPVNAFFNNLTTGPGTITYKWDFGDGSPTSTQTNPPHTYTLAGNYNVSLIATSDQGCFDTTKNIVTISTGSVQSNFTAPDSVCVGTIANFQNTSVPTPNSSVWNFGDGSPLSNQFNNTHTYAAAGTYNVTLNNTFSACSDSVSKLIHVLNPPTTAFTAVNTSKCKPPLTVNFQDQSTGGATTWLWDFGDGSTSTLQNPVHTYNSYGQFNVTLTTSNASGCNSPLTKSQFVQVLKPGVGISNLPGYGCAPFSFSPILVDTAVDGVASYFWDFGNGNTFNGLNPPAQVYNAGKYKVTVTITTNGGCTASYSDSIKVGTVKPTPAFTAAPTSVCVGQNVQFTDQSTGGANQWLWIFGDGGSSPVQNPSYAYTKPGNFSVKLTAYNNGCYDTLTKVNYIVVNPPYAKFVYVVNCNNKSQYTFSDSSIGALTWDWDFGDMSPHFTGANPPPHTYPPGTNSYTVKLTVTNGGCTNTSTQIVTVNQQTTIFASANPICNNNLVIISTSFPPNITFFNFDFGDGATAGSGSGSTSHVYSKPGTYTIKVYTTDSTGCKDSSSYLMKVNGPTADFSAPVTQACNSLSASFKDQSTLSNGVSITSWFWDFGDGATSNQQNPTHLYTVQGSYPVKLKVTDASGCSDSIVKSNFITLSVPVAKFTASDSMSCPNKTIAFKNASINGFNPTYYWDFGNGNTFNGPNPPPQLYTAVNVYTISLTLTDAYSCVSTYTKNNYLVIDTPAASFNLSDSFISCPPLLVHFTFTGHYNKTVQWTFGDGGGDTALNTTHLYGVPGKWPATLRVISPGGCIATASKTVTINGPSGAFTYSPLSGCDSLTVNFNVVTSGVIQFKWFFSDGEIDSTTTPSISHQYKYAGTYLPVVQLEDTSKCNVAYPGSQLITVDSAKAGFTIDNNTLCSNGTVTFTDTSKVISTISNYFWDFGDGSSLTGMFPNPSHYYSSTGSYTVKLVITTQYGCQDSIVKVNLIKVVATPAIDIGGVVSQCVPATLNFTGIVLVPDTSALSWKWDFDNGQTSTIQNPVAQAYPKPGHYIIQASVINSSGCKDSATSDLFIYPLPNVYAGADTTICLGQNLPLLATGANSYTWLPPTNSSLSCTSCANPIATPVVTTSYYVNGISANGCPANDTIVVTVNQPVSVNVSADDSVCLGQNTQLTASGAFFYAWSPAAGLSNATIANPIASPATTTTYQVVGSDNKYCFSDTQYVKVSVFNYPTINVGPDVTILVGSSYQITGSGSADIVSINWTPTIGLSCTDCLSPLATPKNTTTYIATVVNNGTCVSADSIKITVICNDNNLFIPNTFSPNGDGVNDVFYVRGKGLNIIPSIIIFNRWGQIVFEKRDFAPNDPSAGWDGTINGQKAPIDVYVYTVQIICDNSTLIPYHGNVTLIR